MKFVRKLPQTDKALSERLQSAGWKKIREPSGIAAAIACSLPFVLLSGGISFLILYVLDSSLFGFLRNDTIDLTITLNLFTVLYIVGIFIFMLLHEMLHAVFIPDFIRSGRTFWGMNGPLGFVFTTQPLKKARFIVVSLMPLVLLSVILPAVLRLLGLLSAYAAFLCFINALGSCVDCLTACLIAFQVPNGHVIISNGFETYHTEAARADL
jgi:hypothetical protein